MIDASMIATAIRIAISALGLSWLAFWLYRDYWIERFRQEMFSLRDEFFIRAADGLIPFTHPAYGLLRSTMNGFIRFGQRISHLETIVLARLLSSRHLRRDSFAIRWEASLVDLEPAVKQELQDYLNRMHSTILIYLLFGSAILLVTVILPVIFFFACRYYLALLLDFFSPSLDDIDSAAMEHGGSNRGDFAAAAR